MEQNIPLLSTAEQRVLGSLMEKSRTTPDYYPMTLNGLAAACNQKTSRYPIVQFDNEVIIDTIDSLKKKGLVSTATGGSSRVVKYKHNFAVVFPLVPAELAIICLLLLRGPQTPGELNTNSGRIYEFETLDEVNEVLQKLSDSQAPFVKTLERRPGQKEVRYVHLLGEVNEDTPGTGVQPLKDVDHSALEERVVRLEEQLADLRKEFDKLMDELS
jgi:uncharacterized protein YceH (UPF0502 family)